MADGYDALTEKEKEMLRLMARGHDAKSAASALSLSVHTINERLRAARRKLAVTSSREAARLVLDREGEHHENLADKDLGEDPYAGSGDQPGSRRKGAWLIGGIFMSVLTAAALLRLTPLASDGAGSPDAETAARDAAVEAAARNWLALGDAGNWQASFDAAGESFRSANSVAGWAAASAQARVPLGAVVARNLATIRYLNAPPHGYQEVTFHTRFANKSDAVETVTLVKEDGQWKVVGILID
ncbi:MAG: LuxR family transcriptional regulator [Erythrobacter sp.]|nr:LuxR family transcriptional regulator [Erythrobacter sp.]|tara:strand:- start:825 stop:1553 length:729 start_codon:yes stop_codon:yes gene_type:complete